MSPRWLHWPAAVAGGTDYTDYMVAGTSYWIIPDGTSATVSISGPTGGDASVTWNQIRRENKNGATITTSQAGSVTIDTGYKYVLQGGFNQLSNPYQFAAIWCDGSGIAPYPAAPGWVIFETESTPGTATGFRQTFAPIEVQSGTVGGAITAAGYGPTWNDVGRDDSILFFFSSYTTGHVQGWTAWDGVTTP